MKIHFVGCAGVSMNALMQISESYGHTVTGSDLIKLGHRAENVHGAELVVYTAAAGEKNVEVQEAKRLGIPTVERAGYLGCLSKNYKTVLAVSGSHGKTTSTGFLASALSGLNPTLHIGGSVCGGRSIIGGKDYFISEACEYRRSFLTLRPDICIVLNIELDHTDYYKDYDDYLSAFGEFVRLSKTAVLNGDDDGCKQIISGIRAQSRPLTATDPKCNSVPHCVTFGLEPHNDYRAVNIRKEPHGARSFGVLKNGVPYALLNTGIVGAHNVLNALAAFAAADCTGADVDAVAKGINGFKGMKRRFEFIKEIDGSLFYTDYAHHPTEIKSTVLSAREITEKRLTIIFEPHTFTRTKSLADEFAHALSFADRIILTPIFPAREDPLEGVTTHIIKNALAKSGKETLYFDTFTDVFACVNSTKIQGEIIVLTGAGDGILNAVRSLRGQ